MGTQGRGTSSLQSGWQMALHSTHFITLAANLIFLPHGPQFSGLMMFLVQKTWLRLFILPKVDGRPMMADCPIVSPCGPKMLLEPAFFHSESSGDWGDEDSFIMGADGTEVARVGMDPSLEVALTDD